MAAEMHTLDNGVTVLIDPIKDTETVAVGYGVRVGARFETKRENGITHFLEHMAFKEETPEASFKTAQLMEAKGGFMNAFTSKDMTFYYAMGLAENFNTFNDIMGAIALDSVIPDSELEIERGVIIGEVGQSLDDPKDILHDTLFATAYPNQPLGRSILGPKKNIERFKRDDFMKFIDKHYHTGNTFVTVAGNVDVQAVLKRIEETTAALKTGKRSAFKAARFHSGSVHTEKQQDQLHLSMEFNSSALENSHDSKAEMILSRILGGGFSSRLFQEVREKRGLGYSVSASSYAFKGGGLTGVDAIVNPEKATELLEAVTDEIKKIADGGVSDEELSASKAKIKTQFAFGAEGTQNRMAAIRQSFDSYGELRETAKNLAEYDAITKEDVKDAAERVFSGLPVLATVGPGSKLPEYDKVVKSLKL